MAEYYAVLSKAVAGLEGSGPDARRAVYDKARNALIGQLKAIDPPLPTAEISRQRLELEEAIRRVERETSGGSSSAPARSIPVRSQPAPPPPPAAPVQEQPSAPPVARQSPQDVFRRAIQEAEQREAASETPRLERAPVAARVDTSWNERTERNDRAAPPAARPAQSYLPSQGYVDEPARNDEPRLAPDYDYEWDPNAAPSQATPRVDDARLDDRDRTAKVKRGGRRMKPRDDHELMEQQARPSRLPVVILVVLIIAMLGGLGALAWSQRAVLADLLANFDSGSGATSAPAEVVPVVDTTGKETDRLLPGDGTAAPPASDVRVVSPGPTNDAIGALATDGGAPAADGTAVATAPPAGTQPTAVDPDALVAQHATLYEEPLDSAAAANGVVAINAAVTWSYEPQGTDGPELVARIDVPERGLKIRMAIRRNTDQTLPASHVVEVVLDVPASFPGVGVRDVPRLVLKPAEDARGQPLIGASAKVADGFFWIALSGVDTDVTANLRLLKERGWFDLPLVYENGQRAILTFEKGNPGERVFEKTLTAWAG